ncbi:MAG: hypothetical protein VB035_14220 [Candidatus Fimivivens sp.]|nr:hypothetical protein [Candidatus Fimivivens sp.]
MSNLKYNWDSHCRHLDKLGNKFFCEAVCSNSSNSIHSSDGVHAHGRSSSLLGNRNCTKANNNNIHAFLAALQLRPRP